MNSLRSVIKKLQRTKTTAREVQYAGLEIFDESSEIYVKASKTYKLTPYDGDIVLFYAKEHFFFLDKGKNIGFKKLYIDESTKNIWKEYASSISIFEIEGEHSDMFDAVHGNEFALTLQRHLDQPVHTEK